MQSLIHCAMFYSSRILLQHYHRRGNEHKWFNQRVTRIWKRLQVQTVDRIILNNIICSAILATLACGETFCASDTTHYIRA